MEGNTSPQRHPRAGTADGVWTVPFLLVFLYYLDLDGAYITFVITRQIITISNVNPQWTTYSNLKAVHPLLRVPRCSWQVKDSAGGKPLDAVPTHHHTRPLDVKIKTTCPTHQNIFWKFINRNLFHQRTFASTPRLSPQNKLVQQEVY